MLPATLNAKIERTAAYAKAARAASTRRAYDSGWAIFTAWCAARRLTALPATPEVVAWLVQRNAAAGYDPAQFAGHALRAGFLTKGAAQGGDDL